MQNKRFVVAIVGAVILYSAAPLFGRAAAAPSYTCCGSIDDCPTGQQCCPPGTIEMPSCDANGELPGYCLQNCIRPGGSDL